MYILFSQAFSKECTRVPKKLFPYISTKTYVVGTQKNRLSETVLLSTQNICSNSWFRKYLHFCAQTICLSKPYMFSYNFSNLQGDADCAHLLPVNPETDDLYKKVKDGILLW